MVRFSDMLGGNPVPEEKPETSAGEATVEEIGEDDAPEPEDVLERLTQYATSTRAADQVPPPEAAAEPASPEPQPAAAGDAASDADVAASFTPVGDDLLPRAKGRKGRS
jgi:hypothetical protein